MPYETLATQKTPALIIYLLDISTSMNKMIGEKRKIDMVMDALTAAVRQMVFRSTKGGMLAARYRIAILAYSNQVYDLLWGVKNIAEVAKLGLPEINPGKTTDTAMAFEAAEKILLEELPNLKDCPAPLICHMTDGEFTGDDPEKVIRRIKQMSVPDGKVLVENIYIADNLCNELNGDISTWGGILPRTDLKSDYAAKLRSMSSPVPESYRKNMLESNYHLAQGAVMLFPGTNPELVALGFQMSAATPVR